LRYRKTAVTLICGRALRQTPFSDRDPVIDGSIDRRRTMAQKFAAYTYLPGYMATNDVTGIAVRATAPRRLSAETLWLPQQGRPSFAPDNDVIFTSGRRRRQ
jgi:hypothetical protein